MTLSLINQKLRASNEITLWMTHKRDKFAHIISIPQIFNKMWNQWPLPDTSKIHIYENTLHQPHPIHD